MRSNLYKLLLGVLLLGSLSGCNNMQISQKKTEEVIPTPTIELHIKRQDGTLIEEDPLLNNPILIEEEEEIKGIAPDFSSFFNCEEEFCTVLWPGLLERPFSEENTRTIDFSYPFASVGDGSFDPHHGVEFPNKHGTPVLAAQDGRAVYAGTDMDIKLGYFWNFYGNVVILYHPGLLNNQRDVFTLYGHLSEILVNVGDVVTVGDEIGKVGSSGAAIGQHLHFEVRLDENEYDHTVNPVLWFAPLKEAESNETATLTGLIYDQFDNPIPELPLTLEKLTSQGEVEKYYYPKTYASLKSAIQSPLGENFAISDIPAGTYRLSFVAGGLNHFDLVLKPGSMGFFSFQQLPNTIQNQTD